MNKDSIKSLYKLCTFRACFFFSSIWSQAGIDRIAYWAFACYCLHLYAQIRVGLERYLRDNAGHEVPVVVAVLCESIAVPHQLIAAKTQPAQSNKETTTTTL